jgi:antitoxin CcdA
MQPNLPYANAAKKATNVSMAESLLAEAKALRINISQAAEAGLARAVAEKRAALWLEENREAIESSNAYVEQHGLPLEKFRTF